MPSCLLASYTCLLVAAGGSLPERLLSTEPRNMQLIVTSVLGRFTADAVRPCTCATQRYVMYASQLTLQHQKRTTTRHAFESKGMMQLRSQLLGRWKKSIADEGANMRTGEEAWLPDLAMQLAGLSPAMPVCASKCSLVVQVNEVQPGQVVVTDAPSKEKRNVEFGTCIWTTGIKMHPLVVKLAKTLPQGRHHPLQCCLHMACPAPAQPCCSPCCDSSLHYSLVYTT